jgi:beta-lactamase superfamily II metal-dependent hydrolase
MYLQVFDVEHGACSLITCDDYARVMVDAGHSSNLGWSPGTFLRQHNITTLEMLVVTNYDEDHVSGLPDLRSNVHIGWLSRNKSVQSSTIKNLKSDTGFGPGIESLMQMIDSYTDAPSAQRPLPAFAGLSREQRHNDYPVFDDENNLSVLALMTCNGVGVLFTGDLEEAGWAELLRDPAVQSMLNRTNIFMASHHGRESGINDDVFDYCTPEVVVISDCGYQYNTQETVPYYASKASGVNFRNQRRYCLTTRNDGSMTFEFPTAGPWKVY